MHDLKKKCFKKIIPSYYSLETIFKNEVKYKIVIPFFFSFEKIHFKSSELCIEFINKFNNLKLKK